MIRAVGEEPERRDDLESIGGQARGLHPLLLGYAANTAPGAIGPPEMGDPALQVEAGRPGQHGGEIQARILRPGQDLHHEGLGEALDHAEAADREGVTGGQGEIEDRHGHPPGSGVKRTGSARSPSTMKH